MNITPKYDLVPFKLKVVTDDTESFGKSLGGLRANATSTQQGSGDEIYKVSHLGLHLGAADFADAPFSVSMEGALVATSATISGTITATSGEIGGFTIGATDLSATSGGNTTILSSGATAFSAGPTGSPATTITQAGALTATNATITGSLTAGAGSSISGAYISNINADDITTGTLTGRTVRTSASGARVEMKSELFVGVTDSSLVFYDSSENKLGGISSLDPDTLPVFTISGLGNSIYVDLGFNAGGAKFVFRSMTAGGVYYDSAYITSFGGGVFDSVTSYGNVLPATTSVSNLGSSSYKWKDLYLSQDCIVERQIRLTPRTSAAPYKGSIMFFSTDDTLRVYDGTSWRIVNWT